MRVGRLRRMVRLMPFLIGPWALASGVAARLAGLPVVTESVVLGTVGRALFTGALIGTAAAWLESGPLARSSRTFPLWAALTTRAIAYALVVAVVMGIALTIASWVGYGVGPFTLFRTQEVTAFLRGESVLAFFALLLAASFIINFGLQLRRMLGPETLRALFLGTYRRPRREERAFAFLDLSESTAWAERLGPLEFTDFKNDFFADVAEPVLATGGRIVQYVGDEVMVSWPMKQAVETAAPLRFYFLVEDRVAQRAERYRTRYGDVPRFKAGVHGGWVVTAEVGDLKRDIVHSGDVVNTAARIEGECRPRGHRLLISSELADRMRLSDEMSITHLGEAVLRGKSEPVGLSAVERVGLAVA